MADAPNSSTTSPSATTSPTTTPTTPATTPPATEGTSLVGAASPTPVEGTAPPPPAEGAAADGGQSPSGGEPLTADALTIPEGLVVDEPTMTAFVDLLNKPDLSRAQLAQELVNLQGNALRAAQEAATSQVAEMHEAWRTEVVANKEIGGDKLPATMAGIARLIDNYGGDTETKAALREAFDYTGAGNHPQVVAFLSRVAKELVVEPAPQPGSPPSAREGATLAQRLFPDLSSTG